MSDQPMSEKPTQFDYLLNQFEVASQADNPAALGYAEKRRRALFEYVRALEADRASLNAQSLTEDEIRPLAYAASKGIHAEGWPSNAYRIAAIRSRAKLLGEDSRV